MDRDQEDKRGNDDRARDRLDRVKAHRRPRSRRSAFMVHRMGEAEPARAMEQPVGPIEETVVEQQIEKQADRQIPERPGVDRSEEHTSELQSLMRISYAVFCLKQKKKKQTKHAHTA